jgi:hypothetical protein
MPSDIPTTRATESPQQQQEAEATGGVSSSLDNETNSDEAHSVGAKRYMFSDNAKKISRSHDEK